MSDENTYTILCGYCEKPVASRIDGEEDGEFGCADCDNWASKEEVIKIAGEHATHEAQLALNRSMRDAVRGSKVMSFEGQTTSSKQFRFKTDIKL